MGNKQPSAYDMLMKTIDNEHYTTFYEAFIKNEFLKKRYIDNRTLQSIADEYGVTKQTISHRIDNLVADTKIKLAEESRFNYVDSSKDETKQFEYLRRKIEENGITSVHIADEVSLETLESCIKVNKFYIAKKINNDREKVIKKLRKNKIITNPENKYLVADLFIQIFENKVKNFTDIQDEWIRFAYFQIQKRSELFYTYIYPTTTLASQKFWNMKNLSKKTQENLVIDKFYEVKEACDDHNKNYPKGSSRKYDKAKKLVKTEESINSQLCETGNLKNLTSDVKDIKTEEDKTTTSMQKVSSDSSKLIVIIDDSDFMPSI